ncbi:hypothetical protein swp_2306 [Shewanella piezotolerans WP3]|uniref:Uncharacterized protein n=1 Tax=Shewanella piezotolerans (strain WP3 / JCM 13877) TaxID=225849 RepID=B8CNT2_SHEPW|nr:hypothetical protein swp_2306 [Shewanella piezotolerans WP3]
MMNDTVMIPYGFIQRRSSKLKTLQQASFSGYDVALTNLNL